MGSANERQCYNVTSSLIGSAHSPQWSMIICLATTGPCPKLRFLITLIIWDCFFISLPLPHGNRACFRVQVTAHYPCTAEEPSRGSPHHLHRFMTTSATSSQPQTILWGLPNCRLKENLDFVTDNWFSRSEFCFHQVCGSSVWKFAMCINPDDKWLSSIQQFPGPIYNLPNILIGHIAGI